MDPQEDTKGRPSSVEGDDDVKSPSSPSCSSPSEQCPATSAESTSEPSDGIAAAAAAGDDHSQPVAVLPATKDNGAGTSEERQSVSPAAEAKEDGDSSTSNGERVGDSPSPGPSTPAEGEGDRAAGVDDSSASRTATDNSEPEQAADKPGRESTSAEPAEQPADADSEGTAPVASVSVAADTPAVAGTPAVADTPAVAGTADISAATAASPSPDTAVVAENSKADEEHTTTAAPSTVEPVEDDVRTELQSTASRKISKSSSGDSDTEKSRRHIQLSHGLRGDDPAGSVVTPRTTASGSSATAATSTTAEAQSVEAAAQEEEPQLPIERGKSFAVSYMGSTQLFVDGPLTKNMRVTLAYEAVSRVKQPDGEPQPLIPVYFYISTESVKIIHRTDEVTLMDHPLRSVSYVADIGQLVVLMARRRIPQEDGETGPDRKSKLLCHVLESDDAHHISETIGFAFNYAYRQFLTQNGIDEESLAVSDYADILSVQRMPQDELAPFMGKEGEDEFQLVKKKGEQLGISIMESGWGSMIPTVTVSHLMKGGAAARCNRINVGDQVLAVAGKSLVGIPVSECMEWIKTLRYLTMVKVKVVHTPPVVDVNIVRPDLKFPMGFSVIEGTVTSLLRGSIGERGGIRVGHHIIEINSHSTVNMKSDQLLDMLSTATGHIRLKTMSLHLYRIMTGELIPEYM